MKIIFLFLRKRKYEEENKEGDEDKAQGGTYLELLLFNKEIKAITFGDALFLLNVSNSNSKLQLFHWETVR